MDIKDYKEKLASELEAKIKLIEEDIVRNENELEYHTKRLDEEQKKLEETLKLHELQLQAIKNLK